MSVDRQMENLKALHRYYYLFVKAVSNYFGLKVELKEMF
jgi:hypothetical protein